MTQPRPWNRWGWAALVAVTAAIYAFVIPLVPSRLPVDRETVAGEQLPAGLGTIEAPAGWTLDLASTGGGTPILTKGDVRLIVQDGVWFGSSQNLVDQISRRLASQGIDLSETVVDEEAKGDSREEYPMGYTRDDLAGRVVIIRESIAVLVVRVEGPQEALDDAEQDIRSVIESASTGTLLEENPSSDPGLRSILASLDDAEGALR